jgi:hypothetical protein
MTKRALWIGFAVVVAVGVVATRVIDWGKPAAFKKDIAKAERLDTAHVARHDSSARVDSTLHTLRRISGTAMKEADRIHTVADTTGRHAATVRDSLEMWRTRDSLHLVEIDSLRAVHRSDSLQVLFLTRDRDAWRAHSDSLITAMDGLKRDLKDAEPKCRLLPFVPCPSRTVAAIGGAVGGVVGAIAFARRHQ